MVVKFNHANKISFQSRAKPSVVRAGSLTRFRSTIDFRWRSEASEFSFHASRDNFARTSVIGRESFRNATNAMTPSRRIDMLARARASVFPAVSDVGQCSASPSRAILVVEDKKREMAKRNKGLARWDETLNVSCAGSLRTMSNCGRDKSGSMADRVRASSLLTARDNAEMMAGSRWFSPEGL